MKHIDYTHYDFDIGRENTIPGIAYNNGPAKINLICETR